MCEHQQVYNDTMMLNCIDPKYNNIIDYVAKWYNIIIVITIM